MRGLGMWLGGPARRNDPVKLTDKRPIADYGNDVHTGDAGKDGYTRLSIADPNRQGNPPPVAGTEGYAYQSPDTSFEQ